MNGKRGKDERDRGLFKVLSRNLSVVAEKIRENPQDNLLSRGWYLNPLPLEYEQRCQPLNYKNSPQFLVVICWSFAPPVAWVKTQGSEAGTVMALWPVVGKGDGVIRTTDEKHPSVVAALKMETINSFETSVSTLKNTQRHNADKHELLWRTTFRRYRSGIFRLVARRIDERTSSWVSKRTERFLSFLRSARGQRQFQRLKS